MSDRVNLPRFRAALVVILLALLFVRCGRDEVTRPGEGTISLSYRATTSVADTLRVWVADAEGATLAGPVALSIGPEETLLELPIAAGDGRKVVARAEGPGAAPPGVAPRGIVAEGASDAISIRPGQRAKATVRLRSVVPRLHGITASAGDLAYRVEWTRVSGALRYRVWQSIEGEGSSFATSTDTSLVIALTSAQQRALQLARFPASTFRVRAEWSDRVGIYSDSTSVEPDLFADLPRVLSISPANGSSAVPDTTAPTLIFDRPIDLSTANAQTIRLLRLPSETPYPYLLESSDSIRVSLRPLARFERGASYRVEVGTGLRDRDARPFDQDPSVPGLQEFAAEIAIELYDPLRVSSIDPLDGAEDLGLRPHIQIALTRAALPSSLGPDAVTLADSIGALVPLSLALTNQNRTVTADPTVDLRFLARYTLSVTSLLKDATRAEPFDQNPSTPNPEPFVSHFRVQVQPEGPFVVSVHPANNETAAPVFEPITIRFSVPVDVSTVTTASFNVRRLPLGANIPGTVHAAADRQEFTFTPNLLERDVRYQVVIGTAVRDEDGHPLDQDRSTPGYQEFSSTFRAEKNPQVTAVEPQDNTLRVPLDTGVRVRFSLPVVPESVNDTTLVLQKAGLSIPASRVIAADSLSATLTPAAPLENYRVYNVRVTSSVRTKRGSRLDQDLEVIGHQAWLSRFTTLPESLPPRVIASVPLEGDSVVALRPEIEVTFQRPVRPVSVNADNFFLKRLPSGPIVAGTRSVSLDSLTATFLPAQDLDPSTDYELRVSNWVVDRFDTRLDQDPVAPGRQEFTSQWHTDREHVPPAVIAVIPVDGEKSADRFGAIEVLFSEAMAPAPLSGAYRLSRDGVPVVGTLSLVEQGRRLRFQPSEPLLADRVYQVFVDTTAIDLSGNSLDQDPAPGPSAPFVSAFTTEPDREGPRVVESIPRADSSGVDVDVMPRLLFSEPLAPASISTAAFTLVDSLLRSVPIEGLSVSGDTLVTLTMAESLAWNAPYELRALTSLSDSLGNLLDQDTSAVGAQPFTAGFRTHAEKIPPRVWAFATEGGSPAPLETRLLFRLSEPIDPASVVDSVVALTTGGVTLPLDVSLIAPDSVAAVPRDSLAYDREYEVRLFGLRDLRGNPMDQDRSTPALDPYVTSFHSLLDLDPPRVLWVAPADSASRVAPARVITLRMSEAIDSTTAIASNLQLLTVPGGQLVDGTVSWSSDRRTLTHRPSSELIEGARYEVRGTSFLRDLAGNGLDQDPSTPSNDDFVSTFTVGSRPIASLPDGLCDPPDSNRVSMNGGASTDPDPDGGLAAAVWDWGDGQRDSLSAPGGLIAHHDYACLDRNGCDGLDNDGDGDTDETGANGCDESYRIVLTVYDVDGLAASDTSGVAFCDFLAIGSDPDSNDAPVDSSLAAVRFRLSRAIDAASVADSTVLVSPTGGAPLAGSVNLEEGETVIAWIPNSPLRADTEYEIRLTVDVRALSGRRLDQDPCVPGPEPFVSHFRTRPRIDHRQEGGLLRR